MPQSMLVLTSCSDLSNHLFHLFFVLLDIEYRFEYLLSAGGGLSLKSTNSIGADTVDVCGRQLYTNVENGVCKSFLVERSSR